ncbi:MAG: hypothetical protein GWN01_09420 [Nitrosopumilaceae archaeon]|nr:hypothetical protein [Nitrosopumilaceae archaeon]NIU87828.1 hypothetical protein [Nitrosopumilaceae archaeon]NIV65210.1 hypothetical protein [Nitrosopumilaceae archaeon]NIX61726.1 hypothetical protein [Nitrosopumilaceae archaeon]
MNKKIESVLLDNTIPALTRQKRGWGRIVSVNPLWPSVTGGVLSGILLSYLLEWDDDLSDPEKGPQLTAKGIPPILEDKIQHDLNMNDYEWNMAVIRLNHLKLIQRQLKPGPGEPCLKVG